MNKSKLLPKLAFDGIKKNGSKYIPYILITMFSVFVFFIFNAIYENPMMQNLPHSQYLLGLLLIGIMLLGIILLPILVSTYSFLMKQRKSELGLYNILGLDKKYIGIMMLIEQVVLYVITVGLGLLLSLIFSKLIFLVLLNLAGLDINCEFIATKQSYFVTCGYFGVVFVINLIGSLWQVGKAKPVELMQSSRKGEKAEKGLVIKTLFGIILLGTGYSIAIMSKISSRIFLDFFLAVFLVIIGTRILFKTGSILVIQKMKQIPKIYYQKHHFVTLSGMLYRMRRNAQGLSNICIFSTMIIITLICTLSLFADETSAIHFNYPMDVSYELDADTFVSKEGLQDEIEELSHKYEVEVENLVGLNTQFIAALKEGNAFVENVERNWFLNNSYEVYLISLEDYNQMAHTSVALNEDEVLVFSPTKDFASDTLYLGTKCYTVKEELMSFCLENKQPRNLSSSNYYIILPDQSQVESWSEAFHATDTENKKYRVCFDLKGTDAHKDAFVQALDSWVMAQQGGHAADYVGIWEKQARSMYGGLLFIGIFFGLVLMVCLLLMMYYKQLTEGYEDQRNFKILKQVGMSDKEVKITIKKQIIMVFFLPLMGAIIHSFVGLAMVNDLLTTIHLYNRTLILMCSMIVMAIFTVIYVISYVYTSKAYYKIVR